MMFQPRQLYALQVLIEVYRGEFHAHQCERADRGSYTHKPMSEAFDWLLETGMLKFIGEEVWLTVDGEDVVERALTAFGVES